MAARRLTSNDESAMVTRVAESAQQFSQRVLVPLGLAKPKPEDDPELSTFAASLLASLLEANEQPALPILPHDKRIGSGERGLSLATRGTPSPN